ncbi:hypothetical protein HT031_004181 [Scenedesmus sp. PABB004]|nr:hypothetical protein HT031_004181 [Scenedesmus sp. PABB004]
MRQQRRQCCQRGAAAPGAAAPRPCPLRGLRGQLHPGRRTRPAAAGDAAYAELVELVDAAGGFVHPALRPGPGGAGVVAAADVPPPRGSLVELPLGLRLTPEAAQELLLPLLNAGGLPTMALLDEEAQLALAVAWLRGAAPPADGGAEPKWRRYVAAMPAANPAGWARSPAALQADYDAALAAHGLDAAWWRYFVAQVQQQMALTAATLAERYGRALGGLTEADVLWALGQVQHRKVSIDGQAVLEPWSDLLRHPPPGQPGGADGRCELEWTYGLDRSGTAVLSRGCGVRVGGGGAAQPDDGGGGSDAAPLLLSAGEELWASSGGGELFSSFLAEHGHLAPLAWYLQHGTVPAGLAGVAMRTSDILDSWRRTVASEAGAGPSGGAAGSDAGGGGAGGGGRPTVLWDYLTQQYQQDALTVLAAAPVQHQQALLAWLMRPVVRVAAVDSSGSGAGGSAGGGGGSGVIVPDVDPLELIEALDALLIAAIDAAEEAEAAAAEG